MYLAGVALAGSPAVGFRVTTSMYTPVPIAGFGLRRDRSVHGHGSPLPRSDRWDGVVRSHWRQQNPRRARGDAVGACVSDRGRGRVAPRRPQRALHRCRSTNSPHGGSTGWFEPPWPPARPVVPPEPRSTTALPPTPRPDSQGRCERRVVRFGRCRGRSAPRRPLAAAHRRQGDGQDPCVAGRRRPRRTGGAIPPRSCEVARAARADLVVVGRRGADSAARTPLGSVATHVVEQAPCDVLIVA
jgi:nucleotide-binding universal stress UspA family protein